MNAASAAPAGRRAQTRLAQGIVLFVLVLFPVGLFGVQALRTRTAEIPVIEIVARSPEQGGFAPDNLKLRAGEPVRLRVTSPDVVHGLAIPGLGVDVEEIYPGKVVEIDITPTEPGRYAFACTRWCGVDHWRMRGVIEVLPAGGGVAPLPDAGAPLFQQLGLDIDAMRHDAHDLPAALPSAERGEALGRSLPTQLADASSRRALAPAEAHHLLREDPAYAELDDAALWDLVAWAWLRDMPPDRMARAADLYARDCAACHGPEGRGDGPAGADLPGMAKMDPEMPAGPADFTDAGQMLAASDAWLQGKILRGGMGTGMPEFGSLYTDQELWDMAAYLRTLVMIDRGGNHGE